MAIQENTTNETVTSTTTTVIISDTGSDFPTAILKRVDMNTQENLEISRFTKDAVSNSVKTLEHHTRILETLATTQQKYMGAIAKNTKHIAINLKKYNTENHELVGIISGKKQIPLSVFLIILGSLGLITLVMFAALTHYQLVLDESSISISHQNHRESVDPTNKSEIPNKDL